MSENQNRGLRDFSKYDSMKTEELEEILRLDAETPVGQESDEELLFYVMGVLADRRNSTEVTGKTALEAYESFKQHYLPEEEEIESAPAVKGRKRCKPICWLRGLTAAAAVLVIVMFGSMTANAMGFNIWETVVTWAQETFHFGDNQNAEADGPNPDSELEFTSLQEALEQYKKDTSVVPRWIPDGYRLVEIKIAESPLQDIFYAIYRNGELNLKITLQSYISGNPEQIEQSNGFIETYEALGITYYIFADNSQMRVAWITDTYECYISGELTIDQLKMMIDSIGKG